VNRMETEIRYSYKGISQQELEAKLDEIWGQLKTDSDLATEARSQGIDLSALSSLPRAEAITVRKEGKGFDPVTTALVVAFAPVVATIVKDLWQKIILPRITHDKGKDALVQKK
jgi:hypothetical protein